MFCCFFIAILFISAAQSSSAIEGIAPDRDISVVYDAPVIPDWKVLWDGARNLVRDKHYELAADAYAQLFVIKPKIEEASWEYCKVLMRLEKYQTASKIVSLLLEIDPTRTEYLLVAGQVAAHFGRYLEAEKYFGRVFSLSPLGDSGTTALEGLAYSLRARGKLENSLPLMNQLLVRHPHDTVLMYNLAMDAALLHRMDTARFLYLELLKDQNVDDRILFQAAAVFEETGDDTAMVEAWKRYLAHHPDYQPFRLKLIASSLESKRYREALDYYDYIIEHSADGPFYLLKAAEIAQNKMKRPDRALYYYDKYRSIYPQDTEVVSEISRIETQLADEFLAIVENDGAEPLWADMQKISQNREAIFTHMAATLKEQRKFQPLIDVLEVLFNHGNRSYDAAWELGQLLNTFKEYRKSLTYLASVSEEKRNVEFYRLKADNELGLGLEFKAFASLEGAFKFSPENVDLGETCLRLAGDLGLVAKLNNLFSVMARRQNGAPDFALVQTYVEKLMQNGFYDTALHRCDWALVRFSGKKQALRLQFKKAAALRGSGKGRNAEQLLRSLLSEKASRGNVLLQLAQNDIEDGALNSARVWLNAAKAKTVSHINLSEKIGFAGKLHLAEAQLQRKDHSLDEALELLNTPPQGLVDGGSIEYRAKRDREKCRVLIEQQNYRQAEKICGKDANGTDTADTIFLQQLLAVHEENKGAVTGLDRDLYVDGNVAFTKTIEVIERETEAKQYDLADSHLTLLNGKSNDSVRLQRAAVKIAIAKSKFEKAQKIVTGLQARYGDETSFCRQNIDLEMRTGNYNGGLAVFKNCFGDKTVDRILSNSEKADYDLVLLYARLLWGAGKQEEALALYRKTLEPPVYKKLIAKFSEKNINYQYLTRNQTFWNSMLLLIESEPEIVAELMEPKFLVENLGNETGEIVSENYADYSWQTLIGNELSARQAIFNKNYHFAAKSYEKLLAKDESPESKVDLAKIYGRIGQYRKEAQVYEEISNEAEITPELKESIQQNILQIRPTNTLDFNLKEREGRNGFVDIRKKSLGSTFWFTPMLNQDFWFGFANTLYQTTDRDYEVGSNSLFGAMTYEFKSGYEFNTGLGTEKVNSSGDSNIHYNIEVKGKLDDYVSGFIQFKKESVDDTVMAVENNVYRQYIQTGLAIDTEIGISFGGDLRYSVYSDDNNQKRFTFFSSYSLFGDSIQYDLRYDYQYLFNSDFNGSEPDNGGNQDDGYVAVYWSPETFSEHKLHVQVKKDFFGYLTDIENKMSYVSFDTGVSLEDEDNVTYSADFNIFLEMSPHLLLKGNFSFNTSDVYEEKVLFLSLHYSW